MSEFDLDYKGSGFLFTKNNGETIALETELDLKPGDLVFWRYNNTHQIKSVVALNEKVGFKDAVSA